MSLQCVHKELNSAIFLLVRRFQHGGHDMSRCLGVSHARAALCPGLWEGWLPSYIPGSSKTLYLQRCSERDTSPQLRLLWESVSGKQDSQSEEGKKPCLNVRSHSLLSPHINPGQSR